MKLQKLFSLFLIMMLAVSAVSCDDDDDNDEPSRRALLTSGVWTGNALFMGGTDISGLLIDEDDPENSFDVKKWTVRFNTDGSYISTYDGVSEPAGKWEFTNGEQSILFDKGTDDEETAKINRLTSNELFLVESWEVDANQKMDIEARFTR